jgi:hypothetical protein
LDSSGDIKNGFFKEVEMKKVEFAVIGNDEIFLRKASGVKDQRN